MFPLASSFARNRLNAELRKAEKMHMRSLFDRTSPALPAPILSAFYSLRSIWRASSRRTESARGALRQEHATLPLLEITAREILDTRSRRKEIRSWPSREEPDNRVEPLAKPHFDVPFTLIRGENIFTIGSCFARNVESRLLERGYRIPALDIFSRPEFADIEASALNNYGVPSIYQEFAWALDPAFPFKEEGNFLEVLPGKFIDVHLPLGIRPAPIETVRARREAVRRATARVKDCRVVLMTLGLTEVWYDKLHDLYINTHPRLKAMQAAPDRYVLRVLSFDGTMDYLRRIVDTLTKFGRSDLQILVTVSPVPMGTTHRTIDVMVANTYSKSVLRTAAEHIVAERDNVHYYPSFESIVLSDRQRAFKYDMVHIESELVDLNVGRMVEAYAGRDETVDRMDAGSLLAHIAAESGGNLRTKWQLLKEHRRRVPESFPFAVEYVRTALSRKDFRSARIGIAQAPDEWQPAQRELLEAETMIGEGKFAAAKTTLQNLGIGKGEKLSAEGRQCYSLLIDAYIGLQDMESAVNAATVFARDVVARGGRHRVYGQLAAGFKAANRLKEAAHFYARAVEVSQTDAVMLDYAEVLIAMKRMDDALAILEKAQCESATARRRKEHMLSFMIPAA
jgi:hypothetical protein